MLLLRYRIPLLFLLTVAQAVTVAPIPRRRAAHCLKTAVAGGIAGAVATVTLYPLDAAKTVRQASPDIHTSVVSALRHLARTNSVYYGVWTAVIGSMPSSAIYFGAYETARMLLSKHIETTWILAVTAAATGNLMSSAVFVPKELLKQQMQFAGSGNVVKMAAAIVREKGLGGLYRGYAATVCRNIPAAAARFTIYEELKRRWSNGEAHKIMIAGGIAGALSSGLLTPVDVIKTRVSTGVCDVNLGRCVVDTVSDHGVGALWAGAGSRITSSAAFSAIGFGTLEFVKGLLGVDNKHRNEK